MRHRIFIAINLPGDIKRKLISSESQWPELPVRWVKPENLHITLFFLGYISDEELLEVLKIAREAASKYEPFSINLKKICYGPPKKMPPRMIWVEGAENVELGKLQNDLEKSLFSSPVKNLGKPESRPHIPHITLGRIRQWEFRQIEIEERPQVAKDLSLSFLVNSIEVMESELKRGGAEYTILESCPLKS